MNLLTNGSFETGAVAGNNNDPDDWTGDSSDIVSSGTSFPFGNGYFNTSLVPPPTDGSYAVHVFSQEASSYFPSSAESTTQTLSTPLSAGQSYTFSLDVYTETDVAFYTYLADAADSPGILLLDQNGNTLATLSAPDIDGWDTITESFTPSTAVTSITIATTPPTSSGPLAGTAAYAIDNVELIEAICFCRGTLIDTSVGLRPIEDLKAGDLVRTKDNGFQALRWISSRRLTTEELDAKPKLKPIRIRQGTLSDNIPSRDLVVSPQHRVFVRSKIAQRVFGAMEVLIHAKALIGVDGVELADDHPEGVEYFHILFDAHEIVFANGAMTESLFLGRQTRNALTEDARAEVYEIFPEWSDPEFAIDPARPFASRGKLTNKFVERHLKNQQPFFSVH